jgi:signal transduction histidine kinase/DNA-binding response OmpR family regulator
MSNAETKGQHDERIDADTQGVWRVLVVDDEKDVHEVTQLALKRRSWRRRRFELVSCYSAREAQELVLRSPANRFQVALVDVVMETQNAGLELCRFLRAHCPSSLRIVLRTGQPGVAPEEKIINEYDIDSYMAKPEVTPERLYATVRSCLRSSQDIETLLAFSRQLRSFTSALQNISTGADLEIFMNEGLRFLELKHQCSVSFVKSIAHENATPSVPESRVIKAHENNLAVGKLHPLSAIALDAQGYVLPFAVQVEGSEERVRGGFLVDQIQPGFTVHALENDLTLFMQNWTIAHGAVLLQQRVSREKMLNERMYVERIESIANMVTGVAHEINTPLGVANTANGMIVSLAKEVATTPPGPQLDDVVKDLMESTELMRKNLERASRLVKSFKQLSSSQLSDERCTSDITAVIHDCIDAMSVDTKKRGITMRTHWDLGEKHSWTGFPGHLSQVIVNLIQNTLRYAYKGEKAGDVDIRLTGDAEKYTIEFEDYGAGVPPEIFPRMFEAFVTSGREIGGTGLGLAISHNIMTNLLKGNIACTTAVGKGTKFTLVVPRVVPLPT